MGSCMIILLALMMHLSWISVHSFHHPPACGVRRLASAVKRNAHILTTDFLRLSAHMEGKGRAKLIWNSLKDGKDPLQENLLSDRAKRQLDALLAGQPLIPGTIVHESVAECGTRKFLLRLADGQEIESVLIPSANHGRTTLCVSTQVGCDRGCSFCLTGTMGLVRNLTGAEIVAQLVHAKGIALKNGMPPLRNIVFMGMGDAGRNLNAVEEAARCFTDNSRFDFGIGKVCISTVGPSPEVFDRLAAMPGTMAWSVHSPIDELRRRLVPSTRFTMVELRDALCAAVVKHRPVSNRRTLLMAFTLISGVNDRLEDADAIADFVTPMLEHIPKVSIDLIPYNDIGIRPAFKRPTYEEICQFQGRLRERGLFCAVRLTRGDKESAACGMLKTVRKKRVQPSPADVNGSSESRQDQSVIRCSGAVTLNS